VVAVDNLKVNPMPKKNLLLQSALKNRLSLLATSFILLPSVSSVAQAPTPVFQATFDSATTAEIAGSLAKPLEDSATKLPQGVYGAGISVPRGENLIYEGAGNAYMPAGTLSFFWRPDETLGREENNVFTISGFQRFYFCRWLRVFTQGGRLRLGFYTSENNNGTGLTLSANNTTLEKNTWHHVAVSWNQGRGVSLYVDGKLAASSDKPWFYGGNVNHIGLGVQASSYSKPVGATWAQSYDEVRIYESQLNAEDIARLAKNESPQNATIDIQPLLQERRKRLGLESNASLPVVPMNGQAMQLKQLAMPTARDVLSSSRSGLDGDLGRAWPMMQGYSNAGKELRISLEPGASFDTLQAFGRGSMRFAAGTVPRTLLDMPAGNTQMRAVKLDNAIKADELLVQREEGILFNVQLFNSSNGNLPTSGEGWEFAPLGVENPLKPQQPLIRQEFASYDRLTLTTQPQAATGAGALTLPAMQAVHLLGPTDSKQRGVRAIALDLAVQQAVPGTAISLTVVDPLNYERRTAMVNLKTGSQANGRLRVVLDLRDLVLPAGQQPWLVLYAQNAVQLNMADSRLGFQWTTVDSALGEFLPDQMAYARDVFQELSESRPWAHDPNKRKWLRSFYNIVNTMHTLRPDNAQVKGYWHWTHPRETIALTKLPEVPQGVAPWALYTANSIDQFRQAAHWWIDNRMTPVGEFGAPDGINDDTDLIQDWAAIDLMNGPDPKIRHAIDLVANASWFQTTTDGVSNQVTDTLHIYEWGINAQTLAFMLNIGDPVYYERLLRFASRYNDLMATTGDKGHLHFKSWYFGADKTVTEGVYGEDRQINALLLQPAMLLAWYNGDPQARDIVVNWSRAMMEHTDELAKTSSRVPGNSVHFATDKTLPVRNFGIAFPSAIFAAYDLTGDKEFLDALGRLTEYEVKRKPQENLLRMPSVFAAYLRASGDSRWDDFLKKSVSDPTLWTTSQHNSNYRPLHDIYATWVRTGDDKWLNEGSGLALHHMTWSLPMLTEAEQTTDRVWLPQALANSTTLGDLSILRNKIYPKHSVSWEGANGRFAPLVRKQGRDELEIEIVNLENRPVQAGARLWRLNHGQYEVKTISVLQSDKSKTTTNTASQKLARYSLLPLTLAPSSVTTVTLKQTQALSDLSRAADLGVSKHDATYADGKLTFKVHNIGAKASGAFRVRVTQQGKQLAEQNHAALGVPQDYRTQKAIFTVPVADAKSPVTIEIVPEGELDEITTVNNKVVVVPGELLAKEREFLRAVQ